MTMSASPSPDKQVTDERLETLFRAGDDSAFEVLYQRYRRPLLGYLTRLCGNVTRAQDMFQETFVRVFTSRCALGGGIFRVWLYKVATNVYRETMRKQAVRRELPLGPQADQAGAFDSTDAQAWKKLAANELHAAVHSLSDKYRISIMLSCFQGFSYADIAQLEACSVEAVKSCIFEARKMLRSKLSS